MSAQQFLPLPPGDVEISLLRRAADMGGHIIASEGTSTFQVMESLVDGGYTRRDHCPRACDTHQFTLTRKGRAAIA